MPSPPRHEAVQIRRRSHDTVIRVYDEAGKVIETHEHAGELQRNVSRPSEGERCYEIVGMETQPKNIYVIRSAWRRAKKGHIKVSDLTPIKDAKGGGGVTGESKPTTSGTGGTGSTGSH